MTPKRLGKRRHPWRNGIIRKRSITWNGELFMQGKSQNKRSSATKPKQKTEQKEKSEVDCRGNDVKFHTFKEFGAYIVADPKICHGRITFRGTRIFVRDVLDFVAQGMNWDDIVNECHGFISKEAISEAIMLASRALLYPVKQAKLKSGKGMSKK
jgi:uncharacterized protein (DUF433 family)